MEEKKVYAECEDREQKLEELTQEEADKVAGGRGGLPVKPGDYYCLKCGHSQPYRQAYGGCPICGGQMEKKQ